MTSAPGPTDSAAAPQALSPRISRTEQAERIRPFGIDMRVLLDSAATGGAFSALVAEIKPGEGPPPHRHHDREEYFYILEGSFRLSVAGQEETVGPGTLAFVPRGTVHAFTNIGTAPARVLEWTIPGSNEPYFRAVHRMEQAGGFDPARFADINETFSTEFVPAPG